MVPKVRRRDVVISLSVLGAIAIIFVVRNVRRSTGKPASASQTTAAATPQGAAVDTASAIPAPDTATLAAPSEISVQQSTAPAPVVDTPYVRELIREGSAGTYLRDLLSQQDNLLMRWPDRRSNMRVFIERDPGLADWNPKYPAVAEHAFDEWQEAGFPLRFDMVLERSDVDIHIKWIDRFPAEERQKLGMATKVRDQHGWLVSSEISIATHDSQGQALPPELVAATARHEIGHALGLGHSSSASDVMYPESRTPVISRADRQTLHVLYLLPPGRVP